MNLEDYQTVFTVTVLGLVLVAASPTISLYLHSGRERFSELWVLGPNRMAEDYPFNVTRGKRYSVFVGVGCHMGGSTCYAVYVKFRNQTQPLPNATLSEPSPLEPLYEFQVFVADEMTWESQVNFTVLGVVRLRNSTFVRYLSINDVVFGVNSTATWDSEYKGFFYQVFFELWIYDTAVGSFQYHNRFVGLWLNMTV